MGYEAERCPGCGRSIDDEDEDWFSGMSDAEIALRTHHHSPRCPVYPGGELELFNLDDPDQCVDVHYRRLGKALEWSRAEEAMNRLHQEDPGLWRALAGYVPNPEDLTVYEALKRATD